MKPIQCPKCSSDMEVPEQYLNRNVKCISCGAEFIASEITQSTPPKVTQPQKEANIKEPQTPRIPPKHNGMTKGQGYIIIFLLIIASGFTYFERFKPVEQWEYTIEVPFDSTFEFEMNRMGESGWELVSARRATDGLGGAQYECIFKRPKRAYNQGE